ncbi:DUF448 domain-containing protein [Campylobacter corcagiensis]|uniref:DUF448 domain-containing protein n=1 Tax=Campylobacter corcagiensis TaxID=1448857 RepID=A0A7M1LGS0_9BACT|nr:DUF448 domain-containing protein [Campylobacter corcagiensis]QKF64290.1 putative RNA-binding protein (DUF448 domain) [Campylobacter corcagiensis]QOQ87521.1 DUF448 domain-containing protein [Campylobacter corcagiensis]
MRTCIVCRAKFAQCDLFRFHYKEQKLLCGGGRSFYICKKCSTTEDKILNKSISKYIKNFSLDELKESVLYGGSSD